MGFFRRVFGGGKPDKSQLIRDLVKKRVRTDPTAKVMGFNESMVDGLPEFQLAGLPEATIVTIVETWSLLKKQGTPETEIFKAIEAHRSQAFAPGEMPSPLNLANYIKYRVSLENETGAPITSEHIESAISVCTERFSS